MATYLLAYTGGVMAQSDADMQTMVADWTAWFTTLGDAVVSPGNPLSTSATIAADGTVSQGGTSQLVGYAVITADAFDAALALAKTCPHLKYHGTVEVYETHPTM